MWYMSELNQFLARMLLPSQDAAVVPSRRQLHSEKAEPASAMHRAAAVSVQQHVHFGQLLQHLLPASREKSGTALQGERQTRRAALSVERQAERQTGRAVLSVERQAERALLQEAAEGTVQEPEVADLAASEPVLPLADEVGEIYMYTADDIRSIAPLWWNYTKQMRVFHETHAQVCWQFYFF